MEEINDDVETVKPLTPRSAIQEGPRRFPRASVLGFGLLSVFLLAVFIGLTVYCHYSDGVAAADLSTVKADLSSVTEERDRLKANLTEKTREVDRLQSLMGKGHYSDGVAAADLSTVKADLSSVTEERDRLKANLTEKTREVDRLQCLMGKEKTCPEGWRKFGCSCYLFLSTEKASWEQSRQDCRARGAHLVIVDSEEEQEFISSKIKGDTWIGLSDREEEGTWKWVDGSPLNLTFWVKGEPSNGGVGEEDCAVIKPDTKRWNDQPCKEHIYCICEK
ncbi:CD209 antigen-like protein C [Trematomus bernacchii]|uniref:CD209 antigen-like protein C n=1 Tax=Trematomus bernacchii TaxID=40690 RepID=UPI001469CE09|nr:CD209 antigen-like protein C [Trematomus bernacchii]